jgi:tripartite-type tricarboxylate transporter receptor subunit TctC
MAPNRQPAARREDMMRRTSIRRAGAFALAASAMYSCVVSTAANAADAFFKNKTVTVVVPVGPGGSFHIYAQIVARHIGRHIPGQPTVIVQNRPGAGGAKSAAYVANAAAKDGTVIGKIVPGMLTYPLTNKKAGYDATTFQNLGAIAARNYTIVVWHTAPVKTWQDLKKHQVALGATGRSSSGYVVPAFINGVLGTKMKLITGYGSGGDLNIAMERGETQARGNFYSGFTAVRPDWIRDKKIRFLLTMGPDNPETASVPKVRDQLKPGSVDEKTFDLLEASFKQGQAFYVAAGVPKDRAMALREAFWKTMMDPALIAQAKEKRLDYNPIRGEDVDKIVAEGMRGAKDPAVLAKFRKLMGAKG